MMMEKEVYEQMRELSSILEDQKTKQTAAEDNAFQKIKNLSAELKKNPKISERNRLIYDDIYKYGEQGMTLDSKESIEQYVKEYQSYLDKYTDEINKQKEIGY
ncbi:YtzH-like family protein [Pseudalkalibacillus caeni]|uniref:Uncharacterized protein n=1 Tax=Exobacillus caeni TaxID=2574798 RepID=A0A5R9F5U9_9BACL|nr:YtzH-like family protein [Pseudalkalibacillus caeni]TLS37008.1 hypothetical protein FCL54_10765 [Pseudalkalibacillus caeni]